MLWLVIIGLLLALAVIALARENLRLSQRLAALEQRLAAHAPVKELGYDTSQPSPEDREPLLLTQIAPPDSREPLLLDTPVPEPANDGLEATRPRARQLPWSLSAATARQLWRQHGVEAIIGAGLFAALAAPAILGAGPSRALMLFSCAAAIAAFGICLWRRFPSALLATFAGLLWAFAAAVINDAPLHALALLGVAALGAAAAGVYPREKQHSTWNTVASRAPGISVAACAALSILPWLSASQAPIGATAFPALFGIMLIALAAALVRSRLASAPALAAAVLSLLVGVLAYLRARYPLPVGGDFYALALVSSVAVMAATSLARPHHKSRALIAGFGAVGAALLVLMAATTRAEWHGAAAWGALFAGGGALALGAWAMSRQVVDPTADRSVDVWVLAGAALLALGLESALAEAARPLGHSVLAVAFAHTATRIGWRGLRLAAIGAALIALLSALAHAGATSPALLGAAIGAALVWVGSRRLKACPSHAEWLVGAAGALALVVLFSALGWIADTAGLDAFTHNSLRALLLLGIGFAVIKRGASGEGPAARWSGEALIVAGLVLALPGSGLVLNPWWGAEPTPMHGAPLLNPLLLGFAAPAALAFAAAAPLKRRTRWAEDMCRAASAVLALLWVTLEIRRAFHGEALNDAAAMTPVEAALYALLALVGAWGLTQLARSKRALQRMAQLATWAALALSATLLIAVAHPWWGSEARGLSYAAALLLHAAAVALTYFMAVERAQTPDALYSAALFCTLAFSWSAGHGAIHGLLGSAIPGAELLVQATWPLALALCLWALRQRLPFPETGTVATILAWTGLAVAAVGLLIIFNPWWGQRSASLENPAAAAIGLSTYVLTAWLCAAASDMRQAPTAYWLQRAGMALGGAHMLTFAILVVRRLHHQDMATRAFVDAEAWGYAAALGAFSAVAFWFGVHRNSALLRLGALAALACAIFYFFFLAFTRLQGLVLASAVLAVVALLAGCAWFASIYRPRPKRVAFGR